MIFKISSFEKGISYAKRLYPDKVSNYSDAKDLLKKFRETETQCGNQVSEIQNNFFASTNNITDKERIFQIEEV
jgi:hypothetical protein